MAATPAAGGAETLGLFESTEWAATPFGPRDRWPRTLVAHARTLLALDYPIIVFWGPEFAQIYNDAYRPILGRKHPRSFGQAAAECWPEIWHLVAPMLRSVLETGEANRVEDLLLPIDRSGTIEPAYFTFSYGPLEDDAGRVAGVFCAVHETTLGVLALRALRAEERAKDEFLAVLAHELRNPLAPIRSAVELLRLGAGGAPAAHAIEVLDRQTRQLGRLLDDLTDVSRIARGTLPLRRDPLDLGEVIARAVETAAPLLDQRRQRFTLEIADGALPLVGDADRLTQAIANLLNNASRYTDEKGRISLHAAPTSDVALIRVVDDGIGMPPEALSRIFDLYAQAETPDRSRGGSGIGLTLTRRIVELHGGTIEARSAGRGAGSEFVVRLPLAPASVFAAVIAPDRAATPRRRVLVIDDDRDVAESMVALLVELGHDARAAHDGPSAILAATEQRPEVALLDLALPGMTGFDLAPLLRRIDGLAGLSLVALSGFGHDAARERTLLSGFDGHLLKPIDRETLEGVLRRAT